MRANRRLIIEPTVLGAILGAIVMGWQPQTANAQVDEMKMVDDTPADIAVRAEASASDLASSLTWAAASMQTAESSSPMKDGQLSQVENDALVESAAKEQITAMAAELDQLSAALASGKDPAATRGLLLSLRRRGAVLSTLAQRTNQPLLPSELQNELVALWRDVERLSTDSSPLAVPADGGAVVESPE